MFVRLDRIDNFEYKPSLGRDQDGYWLGSGQKSNGHRPVNKVDGGKREARKAMHKSRRQDAKRIIKKELDK